MRMRTLAILLWFILAWVWTASAARAEPAALVLETSGTSMTDMLPYSEVQSGTEVTVAKGAKLTFLDYTTCQTVAVVGGTVKFGEQGYDVIGGTKEVVGSASCPRQVRCTAAAGCETAGVLMRGVLSRLGKGPWVRVETVGLSPRPGFVLLGRRADEFASVRVSQGPRVLLDAVLVGREFQWPREQAPLASGTPYELVLVPRTSGTVPIAMKVTVPDPTAPQSSDELLLLTVD